MLPVGTGRRLSNGRVAYIEVDRRRTYWFAAPDDYRGFCIFQAGSWHVQERGYALDHGRKQSC
jgi:hypothetical protein